MAESATSTATTLTTLTPTNGTDLPSVPSFSSLPAVNPVMPSTPPMSLAAAASVGADGGVGAGEAVLGGLTNEWLMHLPLPALVAKHRLPNMPPPESLTAQQVAKRKAARASAQTGPQGATQNTQANAQTGASSPSVSAAPLPALPTFSSLPALSAQGTQSAGNSAGNTGAANTQANTQANMQANAQTNTQQGNALAFEGFTENAPVAGNPFMTFWKAPIRTYENLLRGDPMRNLVDGILLAAMLGAVQTPDLLESLRERTGKELMSSDGFVLGMLVLSNIVLSLASIFTWAKLASWWGQNKGKRGTTIDLFLASVWGTLPLLVVSLLCFPVTGFGEAGVGALILVKLVKGIAGLLSAALMVNFVKSAHKFDDYSQAITTCIVAGLLPAVILVGVAMLAIVVVVGSIM